MTDILKVKVNGEWVGIPAIKGDPGQDGQDGQDGADGIGVPSGGTEGQTLAKKTNTDYDTEWKTLTASDVGALPDDTIIPTVNNATLTITQGGTSKGTFTANASTDVTIGIDNPSWGSITGTLSNQTDLNTALSGKVNTSNCYQIYPVIQTFISGTSWYRIYSDGWCEMGGYVSNNSSTITFLKEFANTNYSVSQMPLANSTSSFQARAWYVSSKLTTSITFAGSSDPAYWQASGYLASGQY